MIADSLVASVGGGEVHSVAGTRETVPRAEVAVAADGRGIVEDDEEADEDAHETVCTDTGASGSGTDAVAGAVTGADPASVRHALVDADASIANAFGSSCTDAFAASTDLTNVNDVCASIVFPSRSVQTVPTLSSPKEFRTTRRDSAIDSSSPGVFGPCAATASSRCLHVHDEGGKARQVRQALPGKLRVTAVLTACDCCAHT